MLQSIDTSSYRTFYQKFLFVGIVVVAVVVRLWGIGYDLPYIYHPDEPVVIEIIQNMVRTGDLNPHFFGYSSLTFYLHALAYVPYYWVGKLVGIFQTRQDVLPLVPLTMGVTYSPFPTAILLDRLISVSFGVGVVVLTFFVAKKLSCKHPIAFFAMWMVAVDTINVTHSRIVTPNIYVVFFSTATFLFSVFIYRSGKTWHYVMAGLCAGFTVACKYNGGLIILPLLVAHFFRYGKRAMTNPNLYIAGIASCVGFLATMPFAILDFSQFSKDLVFHAQYYRSASHPGMEGDALRWYITYMGQTGGVIYIFAILGILRGLLTRSRDALLLAVFPLVYFAFISTMNIRNDRTFLPLTPFLFIFAAQFLVGCFEKVREISSPTRYAVCRVLLVCITVAALAFSAFVTVDQTIVLTRVNSRETARVWLDAYLSPGSRVALESYSPFVDPARFSVEGVMRMIDHEPDWYVENGFEYLVFGQAMYGRFFADEAYAAEVAQYNAFFNRFTLVRLFTDGNYEVRVYKLP